MIGPSKGTPGKYLILASLMLGVLGCSLTSTLAGSPEPATASAPTAGIAATDQPVSTSDPLAMCPKPAGDTQLYINSDDGYCLLYPTGFSVQPGMGIPALPILNITGPQVITPAPKQQEGFFNTAMTISRNGPPEGMESQGYASLWMERFAPGMNLPQEPVTIGGIPAVRVRNVPSYASETAAFVVSPYARYTVNLYPEPELSDPALAGQGNLLWDTVIHSLVFFEPQKEMNHTSSTQVCPQPGEGEAGFVNQVDGYCMVYPTEFREDPTFPGRIIGGPILGSTPDFPDIQTNLVVGTFGVSDGMTPRDFIARLPAEYYDPGSIVDMTIGGSPAVVYNNLAGPWRSRNAYIVRPGGDVYTIVSQPDDIMQFPEGIPYLNTLFNKVVMSLQFFTPWR